MQLSLFLKGLKTITRINIVNIGITFNTVSLNQPTFGIQEHLNSSKTQENTLLCGRGGFTTADKR